MKRRNCGMRRSIFICWAPALAGLPMLAPAWGLPALPRKRLSRAIGPLVLPSILKRPMRVSLVTSAALMMQTIASQWSRRACSAASSGRKWSSMNSIVATTMSARLMSSRHWASASSSPTQWSAACTASTRPGRLAASVRRARSAALAKCESIVTIVTRIGRAATAASAAEVRFGVIEGLDGDGGQATFERKALGVAAGLATHEERDLLQLQLGLAGPAADLRRGWRPPRGGPGGPGGGGGGGAEQRGRLGDGPRGPRGGGAARRPPPR